VTPEETVPEIAETAPSRAKRPRRGGRDERGPKVVGMGDHVPDFIALSFEDRMAS